MQVPDSLVVTFLGLSCTCAAPCTAYAAIISSHGLEPVSGMAAAAMPVSPEAALLMLAGPPSGGAGRCEDV